MMCLLKICLFLALTNYGISIIVELPTGKILGKLSQTPTKNNYYSFIQIPYAAPPIGNLRFKAPIPATKWDHILNATTNTAICYQVNKEHPLENEDCLHLHIYTPELDEKLPVLFFIHGGGFIHGSCTESKYGADFLMDYKVVVVTVQYRVGPFGFLSTEDTVIPGNNGLKDQQLALQWVHNNIHFFGGDPNRVTIYGNSAGAASVSYQFLNKKSEGLFWGAICSSGSFLSPWAFQRRAREIAFTTATFINKTFRNSNDSVALHEFLINTSAKDLNQAATKVHQMEPYLHYQINQGFYYAPVLEPEHPEAFITRSMYTDFVDGNFVKVPTVIGITSEESVLFTAQNRSLLKHFDNNLLLLVPEDLHITNETRQLEIGIRIRNEYCDGLDFQKKPSGVMKYFSDNGFTRSVIKHAMIQSKYTDVYFYQFSYDGKMGNISNIVAGAEKVGHTEDLRYVWRTISFQNTSLDYYPKTDLTTQRRLIKFLINFATTLNPTPNTEDIFENVTWPKVYSQGTADFSYLDIDEGLKIQQSPKNKTFQFWDEIYKTFGDKSNFITY